VDWPPEEAVVTESLSFEVLATTALASPGPDALVTLGLTA
jgi:hypothetical protein